MRLVEVKSGSYGPIGKVTTSASPTAVRPRLRLNPRITPVVYAASVPSHNAVCSMDRRISPPRANSIMLFRPRPSLRSGPAQPAAAATHTTVNSTIELRISILLFPQPSGICFLVKGFHCPDPWTQAVFTIDPPGRASHREGERPREPTLTQLLLDSSRWIKKAFSSRLVFYKRLRCQYETAFIPCPFRPFR